MAKNRQLWCRVQSRLAKIKFYQTVQSLLLISSLFVSSPVQVYAQPAAPAIRAGIALLQSDPTGILLELHTPAYTLQEHDALVGPCQQIVVPSYEQSGLVGSPQLPVEVALLGVPAHAEISYHATPIDTLALSDSLFHSCPAPKAVTEEGQGDVVRYIEQDVAPDAAVYNQDQLYPLQTAKVHELGFLRDQRLIRVELFPFQINPVDGTLLYHRQLQLQIEFNHGDHKGEIESLGADDRAASRQLLDPTFEQTFANTLLNYETARAWRGTPTQNNAKSANGTRTSANAWTPPEPAYKITVEAEGLYTLTYAALSEAGLPVNEIDPQSFQLFHDGQEVAIQLLGEEDGDFGVDDQLIFYGVGADERYTRTNAYWLTYGDVGGLRMTSRFGVVNPAVSDATRFVATAHHEVDGNYLSSLPMLPGYDHWYGERVTVAGAGASAHKDITIQANRLAPQARSSKIGHWQGIPRLLMPDPQRAVETKQFAKGMMAEMVEEMAILEVALAGNVTATHHLRLYVNGNQVYDGGWYGRTYTTIQAEFPQSYLNEGDNTVRLELINDTPNQALDMIYLDWIDLHYQQQLTAQADQLLFTSLASGAWNYTVSGFSTNGIALYDLTDPKQVTIVKGTTSENSLSFGDNQTTPHRYLALTESQRQLPLGITKVEVADLVNPTTGADYIIISHSNFIEAIQPLADYRAAEGYRVQLVDVQDIYEQFNYGRLSAEAIRDFLSHAYHNWPAPAPSFVLLVGDGNYDPIGHLPTSGPNFIPPYLELVDPDLGETAADNRYATISGDDILADLHIGRFPAETAADVTAMVEKTLAYERYPAETSWNENILFIADDLQGGGGAFHNFSNLIADGDTEIVTGAGIESKPLLPNNYQKTKVYLGEDCPDGSPAAVCQQDIQNALNEGALLVSYVGHGTKQYWAEEQLLTLNLFEAIKNEDRLPIMLPMTCLEGFYHEAEAGTEAFGEAIVRMAAGGAVASWSPTGFGLVTGHDYLEKGFFQALFHDDIQELGIAATAGKIYLLANAPAGKYDDLLDTFILFGDPALRINVVGRGASEVPQSDGNTQIVDENYSIFLPLVASGE